MRTIGRKYPGRFANGDYRAECAYCGIAWLRSRLTRDRTGLLRCPDEHGRDAVTLAEANAAAATATVPRQRPPGW